MRGSWVVNTTEQAPSVVVHSGSMEASSVLKVTAVPSVTGLLKASDMRTVILVVSPSNPLPSMFCTLLEIDMLF